MVVMPFVGSEVKATFEELKQKVDPDLSSPINATTRTRTTVPSGADLNTLPQSFILETRFQVRRRYGAALSCSLTKEMCQTKVRSLMARFRPQRSRSWFRSHLSTPERRCPRTGMQCGKRATRGVLLPQSWC